MSSVELLSSEIDDVVKVSNTDDEAVHVEVPVDREGNTCPHSPSPSKSVSRAAVEL